MVTPRDEEIPAARTPSISHLITERFSNKTYFYLNALKEPWQRSPQSPPPAALSTTARESTLALLARQSGTAVKGWHWHGASACCLVFGCELILLLFCLSICLTQTYISGTVEKLGN